MTGYEKRDFVARNAKFYRFSNCQHTEPQAAVGFILVYRQINSSAYYIQIQQASTVKWQRFKQRGKTADFIPHQHDRVPRPHWKWAWRQISREFRAMIEQHPHQVWSLQQQYFLRYAWSKSKFSFSRDMVPLLISCHIWLVFSWTVTYIYICLSISTFSSSPSHLACNRRNHTCNEPCNKHPRGPTHSCSPFPFSIDEERPQELLNKHFIGHTISPFPSVYPPLSLCLSH